MSEVVGVRRPEDRPDRVAVGAVGLAAMPLGATAVHGFAPDAALGLLGAAATTALLSAGVAHLALGARTTAGAVIATLLLAIGAGVLNIPASFLSVMALEGELEASMIGVALIGLRVLSWLGGSIGALFGIAFAIPVALVHSLGSRATHEDTDRALRGCGLWLLVVCTACGFYGPLHDHPGTDAPMLAPVWVGIASFAFALGGVAFVVGTTRLEWRRSWLRRVLAGAVRGWTVVPLAGEETAASLKPLFRDDEPADSALVRVTKHGDGAYRTAGTHVPFARVRRPRG